MSIAVRSDAAKILLIESQSMFREAIANSLSASDGLSVVAHVSTICEARAAFVEDTPDLLIADVSLPGESVFDWLEELKETHPSLAIILLAANGDVEFVIKAARLDVNAFVLKRCSYTHLLHVVNTVLAGENVCSQSLCFAAIRTLLAKDDGSGCACDEDKETLSSRENEVLGLIENGYSNKQIAAELNISISTVKTHVSRIFRRLGVSSRRQLIPRLYRLANSDS